jgi:hypothetical protein
MEGYYFDLGWPYVDFKLTWYWATLLSKQTWLMWCDKANANNHGFKWLEYLTMVKTRSKIV